MTDNLVGYDFNGNQILVDGNTEIIKLITTSTTTPLSFTDTRNGNAYQVPVGKKARIIFIDSMAFVAGRRIISSDTQDSISDEVTLFDPNFSITFTNELVKSSSIPAGRFINRVGGVSGNDITILEEAA